MKARHHLFRSREAHDHSPVTYIELFFDLVFVFAITQLSRHLLDHLTWRGAAETLILFLGVWWVWIYTSWTTNWLDPERAHVRLMLIAMMIGGLLLASGIPGAFGDAGLLFALAYIAMQIGRSSYMVWASRGVNDARARNFLRIAWWFAMPAPLWIAGALAGPDARLTLWACALVIEYAGPFAFFRTPFIGVSTGADWDISGAHMAERCALFIIIALGEAVLVTGATFADLGHNTATWAAFLTSFIGSAAMWWIYFDVGAKRGSSMIAGADNAGLIARNAYTYWHMPIVAGVVVTSVGDAMMLADPMATTGAAFIMTACGGPALFLIGNLLFKWITSGVKYPPLSHLIGLAVMAGIAVRAALAGDSTITIGVAAAGALIVTALWEWSSLHGGWQRWLPWLDRYFTRLPHGPD
ncbi:MAG: low temperature requirement protein A [Sphingopyxis sp.]